MRESVTYQAILNAGQVKQAHRILLLLGRQRFGGPNKATRQALEAITDLKQLRRLTLRLLDISSWQELLAPPWPKRRARKRASAAMARGYFFPSKRSTTQHPRACVPARQ